MEQNIKKINSYFNSEEKPIISIKRARALLLESKLSDDELEQVLLNIQQFCEMSYDHYLMGKSEGNANKSADDNYLQAA